MRFLNLQSGSVLVGTIVSSILTKENIVNYPEWLLCDGSSVPSDCELKKFMDTTPNLSGRTLIGCDNTETESNLSLGEIGGEANHILTIDELPSHSHDYTYVNPTGERGNLYAGRYWAYTTEKKTTESTGKNKAHNNMQPYYVINYIIYAGARG